MSASPIAPVSWWSTRAAIREPTWREAVLIFGLFAALVLLWSVFANTIDRALGLAFLPIGAPPGTPGVVDALWHLATAFVLVLPARNRVLLVLAPALSLGLDIDHIFGAFVPTVYIRTAHNLWFVVLAAAVFFAVFGRTASLVVIGAVATHVGVDGGGFPLFAPVGGGMLEPGFAAQVILVAIGGLSFFLSIHPLRSLREPRYALPVVIAIASIALLIAFLWPVIDPWVSV